MKTKVREKANWPVTILLILGLITVVFPLYMTIVIAFKQPTEMTNSVAGILSLPEKFSLANFREAMEVTDFWHSLGNSVLITVITVVLAIVIHSLLGYAIARNKRSKFYKFIYLYVVSGMFVPFAILMMPLVKQTAEMGLDNKVGVIILYTVFYMPMNVLLYSGYLTNIPMALAAYENFLKVKKYCLCGWSQHLENILEDHLSDHEADACHSGSSDSTWNLE